tara:strand:+ start:156 stop:458 length:303 start_codon:yes stop_codon:yes gene_type:complete
MEWPAILLTGLGGIALGASGFRLYQSLTGKSPIMVTRREVGEDLVRRIEETPRDALPHVYSVLEGVRDYAETIPSTGEVKVALSVDGLLPEDRRKYSHGD